MYDITKLKHCPHLPTSPPPAPTKAEPHLPPAHKRHDTATVSPDWRERTDWQAKAWNTLEDLSQSFPQVTFLISDFESSASMTGSAAFLGSGTYLVLSESFLALMGKDEESYLKCKSALSKVLSQLSTPQGEDKTIGKGAFLTDSTITFYTAISEEMPSKPVISGKPIDRSTDLGTPTSIFRISSKSSYETAPSYAKLAGAKSKMQVSSVMGDVRRSLGSLRIASSYGDDTDRAKARVAIRSLQKLLLRSGQKMRRLTKEELLTFQQKRALKQQETERAMRLQIERQRRKTTRLSLDSALASEGQLDDLQNVLRFRRHGYEERIPAPAPLLPSVSPLPLPASPGISGGFTASGVTLSEAQPLGDFVK